MKSFENESSRGLPSPIYVIYVENPDFDYFIREVYIKLKEQFGGNESLRFSSYNFGDIENPESPPTIYKVLDDANSLPFFGERKAVVVENFHMLFKGKRGSDRDESEETPRKAGQKEIISLINDYARNPSPSTVLVFLWHGKIPSRFIQAKMIDVSMNRSGVKEWCRRLAKEKDFDLTDEALEYIFWACGGDFRSAGDVGIINSEIDKLSLLLASDSKRQSFDLDDVKDVVAVDAEVDAFRLGDAMLKGNKERAYSILYSLDAKGEVAYKILGGLNYKLTQENLIANSAEILHKADVEVKTGMQGALYQLLIDYFNGKKIRNK